MADLNVREFAAARAGRDAILEFLAPQVQEALADPLALWDAIAEELPEPDRHAIARPDLRAILPQQTLEALRQGAAGWADDDLAFAAYWGFDLASIQIPVRLWQGDLDVLVPREHAGYLAARIPGATFDVVPGAGHLLLDQHRVIMAWLAGASSQA
jgi:pimeloyl-ACP methyl ester carboxylesterase